ncbi:hypothetical protein F5146DRAFT_926440, partial [Armillaria mellea]
ILSLPAELLESIIISSSHVDGPSAIVSLSNAKSTFYELIYKSPDSHLWREIFLAEFDDPRKLGSLVGVEVSVDWASGYKHRIKARNQLVSRRSLAIELILTITTGMRLSLTLTRFQIFSALAPMALAAQSIPSSSVDTFATISEPICPWPPLSREAVISGSLNSNWLDDVLSQGYPADAVSRFLLFQPTLDKDTNSPDGETWDQSSTGQAFHYIFLHFGKDKGKGKAKARDIEEITLDNVTQMKMARNAAKLRVYNMKYPDPQRCWGPFMPVPSLEPRKPPNDDKLLPIFRNASLQILAFGSLIGDPEEERHPTFIFPPFPHEVKPDWSFLASARVLVEANVRDRAHVVHSDPDDKEDFLEAMEALKNLDHLRMGGAPGFERDGWRRLNGEAEDAGETDLTTDERGKESSEDEIDGWDWAGVTGEWRRIVCWMDYHETTISHLSESTNMVAETIRVMPMSLTVSGYSKPPTPPPGYQGSSDNPLSSLVYTLPVIHVEGESRGSDLDDTAHRQIRGTVRMIGDGAVRWSLTSSEAGIQDPEWVTESVQIGQVGSAMGMIGMWTGVDHSRSDPIGPCWAWKISGP